MIYSIIRDVDAFGYTAMADELVFSRCERKKNRHT